MAVPPIILVADDGISWYQTTADLERDLESPDVNAGVYQAFDATGLRLQLQCPPNRSTTWFSFGVDVEPVTVGSGTVHDPQSLELALRDHLTHVAGLNCPQDAGLSQLISWLTQFQPSAK